MLLMLLPFDNILQLGFNIKRYTLYVCTYVTYIIRECVLTPVYVAVPFLYIINEYVLTIITKNGNIGCNAIGVPRATTTYKTGGVISIISRMQFDMFA